MWLKHIISFLFTDTFASKVAAIQDQYADASIGNVTGSNAVNVFLGIGVAWTIAALYWHGKGKPFLVKPGSLAFSVTLFTALCVVCVSVLMYRRRLSVAGGELGGPRTCKRFTSLFFFSLWLIYILLASLEAYCHIPGFWGWWVKHGKDSRLTSRSVMFCFHKKTHCRFAFSFLCLVPHCRFQHLFALLYKLVHTGD